MNNSVRDARMYARINGLSGGNAGTYAMGEFELSPDEQYARDWDDSDDDDGMEGGSRIGRAIRRSNRRIARQPTARAFKKLGRHLDRTATRVVDGSERAFNDGVRFAEDAGQVIGRSATQKDGILRQIATEALNQAPGLLSKGAAAGTLAVTGNPLLAKVASKGVGLAASKGRSELKSRTGYGPPPRVAVHNPRLDNLLGRYAKNARVPRTAGARSAGAKSAGAKSAGGARAERNAIVRQVMKEHGLSLPAASSYVKKNGLW